MAQPQERYGVHGQPQRRGKQQPSLLFYGFGRLADLPILVGLALFNYLLGLFLRRRWVLALGVSLEAISL